MDVPTPIEKANPYVPSASSGMFNAYELLTNILEMVIPKRPPVAAEAIAFGRM